MTRRRGLLLAAGALALLLVWLAWEFRPLRFVESPPPLPAGYRAEKAAWLGVTWAMDPHTNAEIEALAHDLQAHGVTYIFPYVSYLKSGNVFNPTFDHAASFVARFRLPRRRSQSWVGSGCRYRSPCGESPA
ncbi:MAG: hypothetical protein M5R40_02385 [Anaerolineae bacterium]|nr:hypothetical protein [Anaerolineae bacterium]